MKQEAAVAHLDTLKIVVKPNYQPTSPTEARRSKLIGKLQEQLAMVEAELAGKQYKRLKWVTVADEEGEPRRIQRPVRLKQWWFRDRANTLLLAVRYGAKALPIAKDRSAIEVASLDKLPLVLNTLIKAIDAGELDTQLASVVSERKQLPARMVGKITVKKQ